jgi:hypothetical protein
MIPLSPIQRHTLRVYKRRRSSVSAPYGNGFFIRIYIGLFIVLGQARKQDGFTKVDAIAIRVSNGADIPGLALAPDISESALMMPEAGRRQRPRVIPPQFDRHLPQKLQHPEQSQQQEHLQQQ